MSTQVYTAGASLFKDAYQELDYSELHSSFKVCSIPKSRR